MLFVIFNGLGAFVLDDRDIVIEMLGLGFIKGASLDGKLMAIREHTVWEEAAVRALIFGTWVSIAYAFKGARAGVIAADFETLLVLCAASKSIQDVS